jgi:predicted pyridoxine 5'-phosphate oxidase superfamily flavin-nucleotide-binding protein
MSRAFATVAFTPAVKALQERAGSRAAYARMETSLETDPGLGTREAEFLARADSFYLATVSGAPGFLKVISPSQLGFADFRGNRQYVSAGNASRNNRASMIVMDYVERRRLKLMGTLRFIPVDEADGALARRLEPVDYRARVERLALIDVVAFDWNCPQHITPRFTLEQIRAASQR